MSWLSNIGAHFVKLMNHALKEVLAIKTLYYDGCEQIIYRIRGGLLRYCMFFYMENFVGLGSFYGGAK